MRRHDLDSKLEMAMDARCTSRGYARFVISGGEKAPRGAVPPAAAESRHPSARRTYQPLGRRIRGVVGTVPPKGFPRYGHCRDHDRYFLDNVAGWILELDRGRGFREGQLFSWLG